MSFWIGWALGLFTPGIALAGWFVVGAAQELCRPQRGR